MNKKICFGFLLIEFFTVQSYDERPTTPVFVELAEFNEKEKNKDIEVAIMAALASLVRLQEILTERNYRPSGDAHDYPCCERYQEFEKRFNELKDGPFDENTMYNVKNLCKEIRNMSTSAQYWYNPVNLPSKKSSVR